MTDLQQELFALQDKTYREFHSKLMPDTDKEAVIGIRIPVLRKFAKAFAKKAEAREFLQQLPHLYYEENNLHMMLITAEKDYEKCLAEMERFVPYIDNWATCDMPAPKCFARHKQELLPKVKEWIRSEETYTIRYGIDLLMALYLDEDFKPEYLELAASVTSEEYYVKMVIAWYFATALAKQWDAAIPYIEQRRLPILTTGQPATCRHRNALPGISRSCFRR